MTRSQVTMTNNSIINPTIKYPLATTSFTDKIIDKLYKIIHLTVISGMGYSSRWPKELRYELHHHYSLKLQQYGLKKLLSKIVVIHKVANQNMIDSYQIASGITTPILEIQEWKVDYVNSVWTVHLIKELKEYNIQIKIEILFQIESQRSNDKNTMKNELSSTQKTSLTIK